MKLNAGIIYNNLKKEYRAEIVGPRSEDLALSRPQFYMEEDDSFLSDHLYLATVEHLPKRSHIQKNSVLVCIGENLNLNYYRERMCLIIVKDRVDFFKLFMKMQDVFDKYNQWEKKIYQDLISNYDLNSLLEDSYPVFEKPIYVLDSSFRIIASKTETQDASWDITAGGSLNPESISKYLSVSDLMTEKKNAIKIDLLDKKVLCVNLFNKNGQYEGCVVLTLDDQDPFEGEEKLAEKLAGFLQQAIEKNPIIINDDDSTIKKVFQNLVEELPLSHSQRLLLTSSNSQIIYRCIYMHYREKRNQLPLSYICDIFEDSFNKSYAFTYDDGIVSFVNINEIRSSKTSDYKIILNRKLTEFVDQMGLCAGISNEFSDLLNTKVHYLQAQSAVDNGLLLSKESKLFYYESYVLTEMIINSLGGLSVETYYPAGFANILEHDKESGISYLETLKVFLEEGMSYTSTAQKLFIHRSTLIDRISRIEKELSIDLKDSDKRLQLEILLKAIDLEKILSGK